MEAREIVSLVEQSLPPADHVVTMAAALSVDEASDGEDRISDLPDDLRRKIVSRLPIKDAVRTSALSTHWRHFWRSVPLVLCDAHIPRTKHFSPYTAITSVLTQHPGPFRAVHLSRWSMRMYPNLQQVEWARLLAEKGVEDLTFVNFPNWQRLAADASLRLPIDILRCTKISRLRLGFWTFPGTTVADLPRGPNVFPNLLELGLHHIAIDTECIDYMMECSPELKVFTIVANTNGRASIKIRSQNVVQVVFWASISKDLDVRGAPSLDRLILWNGSSVGMFCSLINLSLASTLRVVGYLEPRIHKLKVADIVIKVLLNSSSCLLQLFAVPLILSLHTKFQAGTRPSPLTVIPSVKILALKLRFAVRKEAEMFLSFMRCFPNVETLHIVSDEADRCKGKQTLQFWRNADPVECTRSQVKEIVFNNFRGYNSELSFLQFVLESAHVLKKMRIVLAGGEPNHNTELVNKLKPLDSARHAIEDVLLEIVEGDGGDVWCFRQASDPFVIDPFSY
ncbi:hypothetical protein SETIT_2G022300v2 [Setaria italica]|uniref:F-box domain-containing protein n=1 Tax=Setaria italica TaxID=4555 RepID=A0A368PUT2_SETIT|nr:hypothetical protein SETIT_2G022300v2 [Setaria italica]